jgi:hypothetical protein
VFHLLASWIKIKPFRIQCTSWLLDQQNIKWLTAFHYIHNVYLICSTANKPAPCKWLGLIHLLQPRICVWRLHGILYLYVLVFIMFSAHTYEIWEKCLLYCVHYNLLSILCRKFKVICLTFVSTFNVNHSVHSSLYEYIIITWPAHYDPHLIFLWRAVDFNSRLLRTAKGRNLILRLFLQMIQLTVKWGKTLNWGPPSDSFIACMRQSVSYKTLTLKWISDMDNRTCSLA